MEQETICMLMKAGGRSGFYYKNLETGAVESYNGDDEFQAASVIKLPMLAAVMYVEREEPGTLSRRVTIEEKHKVPGCGAIQHITGENSYDLESLCRLMITISDNTATNAIIRCFGIDRLNEIFRLLGMRATRLSRMLFDAEASRRGLENMFTPHEIASLLEQIYDGSCVGREQSEFMLDLLLRQQINHKIPGYLPSSIKVAHKTGEDDGIANDAGIVFTKSPFVIVFASNGTNVPAFERAIRELSLEYARRAEESFL